MALGNAFNFKLIDIKTTFCSMLYNNLTNIVLMLFCGFASNYSAMESNKNEAGMNNEGTYVFG